MVSAAGAEAAGGGWRDGLRIVDPAVTPPDSVREYRVAGTCGFHLLDVARDRKIVLTGFEESLRLLMFDYRTGEKLAEAPPLRFPTEV